MVLLALVGQINLYLSIPLNYWGFRAINKQLHKKNMIMQKETAAGTKS